MGDYLRSGERFAMTCQKSLSVEAQTCVIKSCTVQVLRGAVQAPVWQVGLNPGKYE